MQFSFRKPHFWHPPNFAKTLVWHTAALFVFLKCPKNTIKLGKNSEQKNLDQFLTLNLDQFLTLKPPNLGPVFNFTAYIDILIYIYAVELKAGPRFGGSCVKTSPSYKLKIGPIFSLFSPI